MPDSNLNAQPRVIDLDGVRIHVPRDDAAAFVQEYGAPDLATLPAGSATSKPVVAVSGPGSGIPACPASIQDSTGTWCLVDQTKETCIYEQCGS